MRNAFSTCAVSMSLLLVTVRSGEAQRVVLDSAARSTWAALLAVHDTRRADTLVIDRALASPVAPLRAAAARVVGTNRIAARYATLRERLRSERDTAAASDAAFALGLAADVNSCDALRIALASPRTGAAAAWALGEIGAACGEFATLLAVARTAPARAGLLRVAGKWTAFPDAAVVQTFRRSTIPSERWAALYALARNRRDAGAPLAIAASRLPDATLRELAARLMTAALQPQPDSQRIVARLDTLLRDRAPHVRIAAVRSIATFRTLAREPLARAFFAERDANVRVTMAQSVGTVISDTASLWREWWQADTTFMVRRALLGSAWQSGAFVLLDDPASMRSLAADARLRLAMIEGADAAGVERFASRFAPLLDDTDARVRSVAAAALRKLPQGLRDSLDFNTRLAAVRDAEASSAPVAASPPPTPDYERVVREIIAPSLSGRAPALVLDTDRGTIRIALDGVSAPMTSDHLMRLARQGYFTNLRFHRVVPAFVAQGGDPTGDGNGGPGFAIRDELNRSAYVRGAVGMALSGPDTGGSQFFLTLAPQPHLNGHYTVFGRVVSGAAAMDALVQGDTMRTMTPVPQ